MSRPELLKQFFLPIESKSSCNSTDCVYIILCIKCKVYQIGQTNCFKRRFNENLNETSSPKLWSTCETCQNWTCPECLPLSFSQDQSKDNAVLLKKLFAKLHLLKLHRIAKI
ncbi:hypothetical protein BpHYR1_018200 [Brachionus plicatilis]|uniref:GIY-YIG domain-containing protein n=1 Tax=Brachionus plicatilis TaxID=10195 RepID=A0A3M7QI01_BRAPC|nr:hypothetical protein BpHYR1_018200 [Brachionus plicatilis]